MAKYKTISDTLGQRGDKNTRTPLRAPPSCRKTGFNTPTKRTIRTQGLR